MAKKKQITITLLNQVGELAKLTRSLAKNKVNIEAISVTNLLDVGLVRFVPSHFANAKQAVKSLEATIAIDEVVVVALPNRVGALAEAAAKLQKNKINVEYIYGSVCTGCIDECKCETLCIFKTSDLEATEKILSSASAGEE